MGKKKGIISDAILVKDIKHGNAAAMEEIVRRYSNKVYNLAYHLTRDSSAAEEIMQEVFLTVIAKINTLTNDAYFSTWLYRVATNASYGFLRKEKRSLPSRPPSRRSTRSRLRITSTTGRPSRRTIFSCPRKAGPSSRAPSTRCPRR